MRLILLPLLFLLVLSLPVDAQPWQKNKSSILVYDRKKHNLQRISQGQHLVLVMKDAGKIEGVVTDIKSDTLVFADTSVRFGGIHQIFVSSARMPARPPFGNPAPMRVKYVADTARWEVIIPPPGTFSDYFSGSRYMHGLIAERKKARAILWSPLVYGNFLKFNLAKLVHAEVAFSYERKINPSFSWETEAAAIFGFQDADAHYQVNYPVYNYNGFSVTTNPRFYIINPRTCFSPVFMYRYLWFTDVRTGWPGGSDAGMLQDQYRNDFGISLRIGMMRRFGQMVLDWYAGGGIKYILLHQLVYADYEYHDSGRMHWRHPDHSPDVYDKQLWQPVINLGIRIGLAF